MGALFGGAAVLGGNWINRRNERQRASEDLERRRSALKTLIAAELAIAAVGHIGARDLIDAALESKQAGGPVGDTLDMRPYTPRDMPFTDNLGVELLALEQPAIDALAMLRSNLAITRMRMEAITEGRERFGLLQIMALANAIRFDLGILADAFAHISPTRTLALPDQPAELATTLLRRLAAPPPDAPPQTEH